MSVENIRDVRASAKKGKEKKRKKKEEKKRKREKRKGLKIGKIYCAFTRIGFNIPGSHLKLDISNLYLTNSISHRSTTIG